MSKPPPIITKKQTQNPDIMPNFESKLSIKGYFNLTSSVLTDGLAFIQYGAQAIVQDEFTKCFVPKPRTTLRSLLLTGLLAPLKFSGILWRYFVLFPIRYFYLMRLGMLLGATIVFFGALPIVLYLKNETWRRLLFRFYCKAFLRSWGAKIRKHGKKLEIKDPHIFVSNHTSVIDYLVLSSDTFPHATVAQQHGGILGFFQKKILTLNGSLMFNRSEKKDRALVAKKMRDHVYDTTKAPLLIFPEGTCVNNESTVLFHKGAFDLGVMVAPVAIKYDKSVADAYWHSKTQTFTRHLFYLMTRWALVADVWYLPPRWKRYDQSATDFANQVKQEISTTAGLKNLSWDGYWKNYIPTMEKQEMMREIPRERYGKVVLRRSRMSVPQRLGRRMSLCDSNDIKAEHVDWNEEDDWFDTRSSHQTSIRNKVLKSLQEQERQESLVSVISSKRKDVTDTWKLMAKEKANHERLENMSWRLWFKQRLNKPVIEEQESNVIVDLVSKLVRVPSRIYSPNDLYHTEGISLDTDPRRLWDFTDDETLFD